MTHNNECPNGTPTTGCDIYDVCEPRICDNDDMVTTSDTVDVCAVCGVCPIIYDNPPTIGGLPVCDTCARTPYAIDAIGDDDTVEQCDYCGGIAIMECDVCHAMVCDNHIEHESLAMAITHVNVVMDEPNLTVFRYGPLTVAIAHDGSINTMRTMRQIVDMVKRFRLHHVTCITLVYSRQRLLYGVHAVTPSNTVWHITVNNVKQIAMAMNRIAFYTR